MRFYYFMLIACALIAGCAHEQKKAVTTVAPKAPVIQEPFKFHKLVEVAPGQYYDVLSWGRGSVDTGSFLILHSDSAARKYTTTTGDVKGQIVDVYNADMDADGHPEIIIQAKGRDTINYTNIYAFEIYEDKVQKLDFPKLNSSQKKGYRGNDNFYVTDGKLIREFPIFEGSGSTATNTGQKRKLEYTLNSNSFNVKQLSKDSTSTTNKTTAATSNKTSSTTDKKVTQEPVKKKSDEKKQSKTKKVEKKHHKEVHKKKKHRRRHHTDEDDSSNDGDSN
jgi:hypothetical protein